MQMTPPWVLPSDCAPEKKRPTKRQIKNAIEILAKAYQVSENKSLLITRRQEELSLVYQSSWREI